MADGSVVIGVQLDTAAFAASAAQLENQIMMLGSRLNGSLTAALAGAGTGDGMMGAFASISGAAAAMAENLRGILTGAALGGISAFTGAGWAQAGGEAMNGLASGVRGGSGSVTSAVRDMAAQARGSLDGLGWSAVGQNMMSGIAAGVRQAGAEVLSAIREVSRQTEGAVKAYFKIQSPSALMRDEVGVMISRGIAEGITGGASFVDSAVSSVYGGAKEKLIPLSSAGTVNQHIYLRDSDTSPYQTARRIKRESEAALRL